ncbi:DUF2889 domain-containing protein [Aquihabitans sp. McL0605]|uniref:DUF2889 domain-containing protein n=1 Tax=Aquihabitans sp. McL0605 TaxID=3415671 RepID=UPI003CFB91FF
MLILPDRAGPHDPLPASPARRAGSVRRTSSIDSTRPDGLLADVRIEARARDLVTPVGATGPADGEVVDEVVLTGTTDVARTLLAIGSVPEVAGLQELVGAPVASGYRQRALDALPDDAARRTLLYLLVDDMPGAALVAGIALQRSHPDLMAGPAMREHMLAIADICSGWASDATMITALREQDDMPMPIGPPAPTLERDDDPRGWHPLSALPANATRRRRSLDLWPDAAPGGATHAFEAHFRDSYADEHAHEEVVHEYLVTGRIDAARRTFVAIEATARVLPWIECPGALASADRLTGTPIGDVRARVRTEFTGVSTCTHLNDTLRMLADLEPLLELLDDAGAASDQSVGPRE